MNRFLSIVIIVLGTVICSAGLFTGTQSEPYDAVNTSGDTVKMYGSGLYEHESTFKTPIHKGTDFVMLFVVLPLFTVFTFRKTTNTVLIIRLGLLTTLLYFSTSVAFSVAYNRLFLCYLLLFSATLFTFILQWTTLTKKLQNVSTHNFKKKYLILFLLVAGCSVFVWFIDIINSIQTGHVPIILGMATTEPTFIIDIGIIAPSAFLSAYWIHINQYKGILLGSLLLVLNGFIGLIIISQTLFQYHDGVFLTLQEFIPFVLPFVMMSSFAFLLIFTTLKTVHKLERISNE